MTMTDQPSITGPELFQITAEANRAAKGTKGAQTAQTREAVAAMKAIGLKRSDFSARVVMEGRGVYGPCFVMVNSEEAKRRVIACAHELAYAGFRVTIVDNRSVWLSTGWTGHIRRIDTVTNGQSIEVVTR